MASPVFRIKHNDYSQLDLYAHIFLDIGGFAYNPNTGAFGVYTDLTATGYEVPLTEDSNRAGYYYSNVTGAAFDNSPFDFHIEIYRKLGSVVDHQIDSLRTAQIVHWNGQAECYNYVNQGISAPATVGTVNLGDTIDFNVRATSFWGVNHTFTVANYRYDIVNPSGGIVTSGTYTSTIQNSGLYRVRFVVPEATGYQHDTSYMVRSRVTYGDLDNPLECYTHFHIKPTGSLDLSNVGSYLLTALAYPTGYITGSPSTTGFVGSLNLAATGIYNGQVIRMKGALFGQARIISECQPPNTIIVNKPFSFAPSTNDGFVIFPIGGELNN